MRFIDEVKPSKVHYMHYVLPYNLVTHDYGVDNKFTFTVGT